MQPIRKVLIDNGFSAEDLNVKYEPPISFFSDVDISTVLEINELRSIIGYDEKPNYDKLNNQKEEEDVDADAEEIVIEEKDKKEKEDKKDKKEY
jgi:hypothetical protein